METVCLLVACWWLRAPAGRMSGRRRSMIQHRYRVSLVSIRSVSDARLEWTGPAHDTLSLGSHAGRTDGRHAHFGRVRAARSRPREDLTTESGPFPAARRRPGTAGRARASRRRRGRTGCERVARIDAVRQQRPGRALTPVSFPVFAPDPFGAGLRRTFDRPSRHRSFSTWPRSTGRRSSPRMPFSLTWMEFGSRPV